MVIGRRPPPTTVRSVDTLQIYATARGLHAQTAVAARRRASSCVGDLEPNELFEVIRHSKTRGFPAEMLGLVVRSIALANFGLGSIRACIPTSSSPTGRPAPTATWSRLMAPRCITKPKPPGSSIKPRCAVNCTACWVLSGCWWIDPWDEAAELMKSKPVGLLSAREKMPFEIAPLFPYRTRLPPEQASR